MISQENALLKNVLNQYIYAFKEYKIYNKSYFGEVLSKIYNNKKHNDFTLFLADCDKLGKINQKYGYYAGDLAINNSLEILVKNMPRKMRLSRFGGDEFIGIIEHIDKEEVENALNNINNLLDEKDDKIKVNMTFAVSDSKDYDDLLSMLCAADKSILEQKEKKKEVTNIEKEDLKENIVENINSFYDCLRLGKNNNKMESEKLSIYKKFLEKCFTQEITAVNDDKLNLEQVVTKIREENKTEEALTYEEALLINESVNSNDVLKQMTKKDITMTKEIFKKVYYKLLYNYNTKEFNSMYYATVLEKKLNAEMKKHNYNIIYLHTTGLKVANTLIGHNETDKKLNDVAKNISQEFDKEQNSNFAFFNKNPIHMASDSAFLLDMNAGDFLLVIPEERMKEEKLDKTLEKITKLYDSDFLHLEYAKRNTKDFNNMQDIVSKVKLDSQIKNNGFNKINNVVIMQLLEKYLLESMNFYKKDQNQFENKDTQKYFIDTFTNQFEQVYLDKYVKNNDLDER